MCTRWWRARLEGLGQQDCVGRDRVEFNGGEVGTWRDWLWGEIDERERERERDMRGERKGFFFFFLHLHLHRSKFGMVLFINTKCLTFKTSYVRSFLVFGVSNVKYLVFNILDASALDISTNDLLVKIAMSNA